MQLAVGNGIDRPATSMARSAGWYWIDTQAWLMDVLRGIDGHKMTRIDELPFWRYASAAV